MNGAAMAAIGAILFLVAVVIHRVTCESSLKRLTDREKLTWMDSFSGWRILANCVASALVAGTVLVSWLVPGRAGWVVIVSGTGLLLFSLVWQYSLVRRLHNFGFDPVFLRRMSWLAIVTQLLLIGSVGLLAFGIAGSRL